MPNGLWSTIKLEWSERLTGSWPTFNLERGERSNRSWSTYQFERSERPNKSFSTFNLERSERLNKFWQTYNLERSENPYGSWSIFKLDRSEKLNGSCATWNFSEARALKISINKSPSVARGLMILCWPTDSSEVDDFTDFCQPFNLSEVSGLRCLGILTYSSEARTQKNIFQLAVFARVWKFLKPIASLEVVGWQRSIRPLASLELVGLPLSIFTVDEK